MAYLHRSRPLVCGQQPVKIVMPRYVTLHLRDDGGRVKGWAIVEVSDEPASDSREPSSSRGFATKREALAALREMLDNEDAR